MTDLSRRAGSLPESLTLAISAKAKALIAGGERVIRFGVGEPDFDTPGHVKEAAARSLAEGKVGGYTAVAGIPELREAAAEFFRRAGVDSEASRVVVSCGAKHAIFNAIQVLVDDGDEVVLPAPYWVSYPSMVQAAGGKAVVADTRDEGFRLTPGHLQRTLTERTRVVVLNSPSNPTGVTLRREELRALGTVLEAFPDVTIISDEIYQHLVYDGVESVPFAVACPALAGRTLTVNGVSKSWAMTGWRIGYATGPAEVVGAMIRLQSHATSNPSAIAQHAALAALLGPMEPVEEMRRAFERRRALMVRLLQAIPGLELVPPSGAFYCFPDVSRCFGERTGRTPLEMAEALLERERVACVPGEAFGSERSMRFSYACSDEDIEEGCARLKRFLEEGAG